MPSILITPPVSEPLTLTEAKAFLRVETADDDDIIGALIASARLHVEAQTRRALMTQTWRMVRDDWPEQGHIAVRPSPLQGVIAARVYKPDGTTQSIDITAFTLNSAATPALLIFTPGALPIPGRPFAGIEIDVSVGYGDNAGDVPEPLRQAIRLLLAHWYENRALVTEASGIVVLPQTVQALIAPYRVLSL